MPMKTKLFVPFALMLAIALILSACGPAATTAAPVVTSAPATAAPATQAPATSAPATAAPAEQSPIPAVLKMPAQIAGGRPVAITVAGTPPDSQPQLLANWQAAVDRFQALYPNVTIRGTDYTYNPDTFAALIAGNQVPTLFQVYLTDPEKWSARV